LAEAAGTIGELARRVEVESPFEVGYFMGFGLGVRTTLAHPETAREMANTIEAGMAGMPKGFAEQVEEHNRELADIIGD